MANLNKSGIQTRDLQIIHMLVIKDPLCQQDHQSLVDFLVIDLPMI